MASVDRTWITLVVTERGFGKCTHLVSHRLGLTLIKTVLKKEVSAIPHKACKLPAKVKFPRVPPGFALGSRRLIAAKRGSNFHCPL